MWDRVDPAACESCLAGPGRFLVHVYALASSLLNPDGDRSGGLGNRDDLYSLDGAIHAAVQLMHQQLLPNYDGHARSGPAKTQLGTAAARHLGEVLARAMADDSGHSEGWDWWTSTERSAAEARAVLSTATEEALDSWGTSPSRHRSGRVYLLGAGFSCAVDPEMPTMKPLLGSLKRAAQAERWPTADRLGLEGADDLEAWLDSLAVAQPYRSDAENHEAEGLFLRASEWIARHLADVQHEALMTGFPSLFADLVAFWQAAKCTVITMNYDTLVERCVLECSDRVRIMDLPNRRVNAVRAVPLPTTAADGVAGTTGDWVLPEAFSLAKLHGSIDWQHPGGTGRGMPIYAVGIDVSEQTSHEMAQMSPYIIPPCFTKGPLFDHEIIRENWHVARRGLERAEELVVMGYSLPPADTAVVQMLRENAPDKITLLDTDKKLKKRYEDLLDATIETVDSDIPIWDWTSNVTAQP